MTLQGNAIVTDASDLKITPLPAAPLHALEIWSNPQAVAARFVAEMGYSLPSLGKSNTAANGLVFIRYEPAVWLVEGDPAMLPQILAGDGAVTDIGGGILRVRISGTHWRVLLMEGGIFDVESPTFNPGSSAATIIDHVAVRLHVVSGDTCDVYVPASFSRGLIHFWQQAIKTIDPIGVPPIR